MQVIENVICMQASVGIQYSFTSFTLSNFSQSFALNLTNFNQTGVVPAGLPSVLPMTYILLSKLLYLADVLISLGEVQEGLRGNCSLAGLMTEVDHLHMFRGIDLHPHACLSTADACAACRAHI